MAKGVSVSAAARTLKALRKRSGVPVRKIAETMGWQGTRYQHYEDRYKKDALPAEVAAGVAQAIVGKGKPPVTLDEVAALAGNDAELVRVAITSGTLMVGENMRLMQQNDVKSRGADTVSSGSLNVPLGYRVAPQSAHLPDWQAWPRDIPTRGTVNASVPGGSHLSATTGELAPRPPGLMGLAAVFVVRNPDARMAPAWKVGAPMYLAPEDVRPVAAGDHVMVETAPIEPGTPNVCYFGKLASRDEKAMHLVRYVAGGNQTIPREQIRKVWRIFEWHELLGF